MLCGIFLSCVDLSVFCYFCLDFSLNIVALTFYIHIAMLLRMVLSVGTPLLQVFSYAEQHMRLPSIRRCGGMIPDQNDSP